jgi:hypothetical protein
MRHNPGFGITRKAIAIGLLVAVNQVIAAVFALLPKQVWSFADIRSAQERPILAYVISGLRWVEGAGLAGLMALTGTLVVNWLQPDQAAAHPDGQAPPLWVAVLLSASMGALFGATIPHWYRRTMRRAVAASVPAPLAPRGAAVLAAGGDRGPRAGLRV